MYRATSILTALFFVSGLGAGETSFASEATSSVATETRVSSPIETSQGSDLLRQLAIALAAGGEALRQFRGPAMKTEAGENFFSPAMPGMDCSVNGIANLLRIGDREQGRSRQSLYMAHPRTASCVAVGSLERDGDRTRDRCDPKLYLR